MSARIRSLDEGFFVGVVLAAVLSSGCSLIGLVIGASKDAKAGITVPGWPLEAVPRGASLTLLLDDGTRVTGKYLGMDPSPTTGALPAPPAGAQAGAPASEIVIETRAGKRERIAVVRVASVELPGKGGAWLRGFLIGALIDAAVVALVIHVAENACCEAPPAGSEFCSPLVSGFDGRNYVPQVDAFGGAMLQRARYTDWAPLAAVEPAEGRYWLRIEKGHAETEFVDEIRLVVVDHPVGVRVRPDPRGTLRTLASPTPPRRVQGLDGSNVLDLVTTKDGRYWVSNPFGRNPDNPSAVRDGLVLEFSRPVGPRSVKLALRAKNTPWAYQLRGEFLRLLGRDLEPWFARMESSAESYNAFREAQLREVMLTVSLWDGRRWRPSAWVREVGSAIPREVVLALEETNSPDDRLRVRLDATAGLWMIDSVEADYSADLALQAQEIAPSRATDETGRDVTGLLARADGRPHVMLGPAAKADVEFQAPPLVAGQSRTVVLKATGHYRIDRLVGADGEPQLDLVERFIKEPGAWGRYALRSVQSRASRAIARMDHRKSAM